MTFLGTVEPFWPANRYKQDADIHIGVDQSPVVPRVTVGASPGGHAGTADNVSFTPEEAIDTIIHIQNRLDDDAENVKITLEDPVSITIGRTRLAHVIARLERVTFVAAVFGLHNKHTADGSLESAVPVITRAVESFLAAA